MKDGIITKEVTTSEEMEKVILTFRENYYLRAITKDQYRHIYIRKHLESGHFIVEYNNAVPVGFISFYSNDINSGVAFITGLALADSLGFLKGKTLMRLICKGKEIARNTGMKLVRLEVEKDNSKAIKLYEHFGFKFIEDGPNNSYIMEMAMPK